MKYVHALLPLVLLVSAARGELKVVGELKVRQHRMAVLSAEGQPDGAAIAWSFDEERLHGEEEGGKLFVTGPPGSYRIKCEALTLKDGKTLRAAARVTLVIDGPAAPPMPPAPPSKDPKPTPKEALCQLRIGRYGCTATVIGPRRSDGRWDVLTASHCMGEGGAKGTITLKDGRVLKVSRTAREKSSDICWMETDEPHESLPFALLARELPAAGTSIWHGGFGFDRPGNIEVGTVQGSTASNQLQMTLNVSSGDSGGGIFREDTGELVACVCCTRAIAAKTTMFGGHCVRAAALRPSAKATDHGCCVHPVIDHGDEAALVLPVLLYPEG